MLSTSKVLYLGINSIKNEIQHLDHKTIGEAHAGLSLRANERHIEGVLEDIARYVLPK